MSDDNQERRESIRVEQDFRVSYTEINNPVEGRTLDVSKGGLFIKTNRFLPLNTVTRLHLGLLQGGEVTCIARVIFIRGTEQASAGKPAGLGFEFLDMSPQTKTIIDQIIGQQQSPPDDEAEDEEESGSVHLDRKLKVLIVDDDPQYRELAGSAFRDRGDEILTAADGLEALAICLKSPPDVILTDVQMPRMDGWEFLRMLRSRPSLASVLVVFQTTLGGEKERLRGYRLGVDDYIAKPYSPAELVARVVRMVTRTLARQRPLIERKTLRGDIEHVSLPSVLSLLELEKQTGVILVVGKNIGRIFIREGRPLAVEVENSPPNASQMDMAVDLLGWKQGLFEFARQEVRRSDELQTSLQGLLIEAARITDEANR